MPKFESLPLDEQEQRLNQQLREEIKEEVKKFKENIEILTDEREKLSETTKRFLAHFDAFKELSQDFKEKVSEEIKNASHEVAEKMMTNLTASCLKMFEENLNNKIALSIDSLHKAVQQADRALTKRNDRSMKARLIPFASISLIALLVGLSLGYYLFQPFNFGQYFKPTNRLERFIKY